ncbi:CTP synthase [Theileria orientalis strain Shintoku]|uniref:CTP synthase n=1 Tax=Theileria orientalis strain Shintoku TaxID=869250 RepID=J4DPF6_THEOR|nr:CTP synthase [Theileria orientalis strain Shintoku]BAM40619.1 CTP synthase [Theileria orientalis strain Shintoku]|eukprot:XP_009690920.1 CTP synthase [Theileria orientalis strain Shintoku]
MKYVVVIGGTMSGIGKGTLLSSIGVVLRSRNISISAVKIDPYLNLDAGTISPNEHGEVYVLHDGGESDLDLGNYERFLNLQLTKNHSLTSGKVYSRVFEKERKGDFLGKTVQVVPHIIQEVINWIEDVSKKNVDRLGWRDPEMCLLEIGGTVGDIESEVYVETIRQLKLTLGNENVCLCHLSYVPIVGREDEQKSKPTQHSVKEFSTGNSSLMVIQALLQRGLQPDMIFCRCPNELTAETKRKIAFFTQVHYKHVISVHNTTDLYQVPLMLDEQKVAESILELLKFKPNNSIPMPPEYSMKHWSTFCENPNNEKVTVAMVGKYNASTDTYLSVLNALKHSALECNLKLNLKWIDFAELKEAVTAALNKYIIEYGSKKFEDNFKGVDGVLIPGGFGTRGLDGKKLSVKYCRDKKVPLLGICLALQLTVVDVAQEFEPKACHGEDSSVPAKYHAVSLMPEYEGKNNKGASMRLGAKETKLIKGTIAYDLYDHKDVIVERHRHRYQVNPAYEERLEKHGVVFSGRDPVHNRVSILELKDHPFYLCTQFHPEYTSTPIKPSPPYLGFILACKNRLKERLDKNGGKLLSGSSYHKDK